MQAVLTALALLSLPLPGLTFAAAEAQTSKPVWSIWQRNRDWQPCGDFVFALSIFPHGYKQVDREPVRDEQSATWPYDAGKPITVIGWSIVQRLSDQRASGSWIVGSGRWADHGTGADVFASGGGVGTNSKSDFFPPGTGLPQGGKTWAESRFDVYGACDVGQQRFDVVIYYTSP